MSNYAEVEEVARLEKTLSEKKGKKENENTEFIHTYTLKRNKLH